MNNPDEQNKSAAKPESVKVLRLREMLFLGNGAFFRRVLHAIISVALRLFFRRIEAVNVERVPETGAIIFVLNHPNGLIDPALVYVSLARRVSFLAKSTIFSVKFAAFIMRGLEVLPVYRQIDANKEMSKNFSTFAVCYEYLAQNRCIAIFPEGISHDETNLQPLKNGAARIALGALAFDEDLRGRGLKIMPVGLFYTSKTSFRSEALIRYGEPLDVEFVALDKNGEPPREAVRELTAKIDAALRNATLNLESAEELDAVLKAEALFSSVYQNLLFKETLAQSFLRLQDLAEKYTLLEQDNPERMRELSAKIERYESDLKTSGVTATSLSVLQHPTAYVFRFLILRNVILILLAPLSIVGAILHSPAYLFSNLVGLMFKTHGADEAGSTYKILAATVFMPLTWLVASAVVFYFFGWQLALLAIPAAIACGYVALRSFETVIDLTVWIKATWLLFRQRGLFLRLLVERETLQKEIQQVIGDK
ncbi:MAG TPA: lysophospholipid acyltransferase family protein [Pyrinomonadaceae bacterium]|nr:lysophospholipid acyltransferase family protein [Pyrinomonadaceae bacterium]